MRCLLKFNTTPASSHLSGTDSYLITISPFRQRDGQRWVWGQEEPRDRGRQNCWSGQVRRRRPTTTTTTTTKGRIVGARQPAHAETVAVVLSLSRNNPFLARERGRTFRGFLRSYRLIRALVRRRLESRAEADNAVCERVEATPTRVVLLICAARRFFVGQRDRS